MNLQLIRTEEFINGEFAGMLGEVLIRCNNVLYIRAADSQENEDSHMQDWRGSSLVYIDWQQSEALELLFSTHPSGMFSNCSFFVLKQDTTGQWWLALIRLVIRHRNVSSRNEISPKGGIAWTLLDLPLRINYKRCGPCSLRSNITKPISMRPVVFVIVLLISVCVYVSLFVSHLLSFESNGEAIVYVYVAFFLQLLDR